MAGRRSKVGAWTIYSDRGTAFIDTRIAGKRIRQSLGLPYAVDADQRSASDERLAQQAAEARYAKLCAGRVIRASEDSRIRTSHTLHELLSMWLVEVKALYPSSFSMFATHARTISSTCEEAASGATPLEWIVDGDDGVLRFAVERMRKALRITVRKEITSLMKFFGWTKRNKYIATIPARPKLDQGLRGVRSGPQRATPVDVTPEQAKLIVNALPEWSAVGGHKTQGDKSRIKGAFRVRDHVEFAWETGLRPATVSKLEYPKHWREGDTRLRIESAHDKARFGREVPLSARAIEILTACIPEKPGPFFGKHTHRHQIKAAAAKVLSPERAKDFAVYDFRHARVTHALTVTGNLNGVGFLVGHRRATTTNHYFRPSQQQGQSVIDAMSPPSVSTLPAEECQQPRSEENLNSYSAKDGSRTRTPFLALEPESSASVSLRGVSSIEERSEAHGNGGVLPRDTGHLSAVGQHAQELAAWAGYDRLWLEELLDEAEAVAREEVSS